MIYELCYGKRAAKGSRNELKKDDERFESLPNVPPQFNYLRGTYTEVAERANTLNEIQLQSGFLDYLFFPEPVPVDVV